MCGRTSFRGPLYEDAGGINAVAISPDSRTVIFGAEDGLVRIWDPFNGTLSTETRHDKSIYEIDPKSLTTKFHELGVLDVAFTKLDFIQSESAIGVRQG